MFCNKCGYQIGEGSAFCNNCGTSVDGAPKPQETNSTVNQQPVGAQNPQQPPMGAQGQPRPMGGAPYGQRPAGAPGQPRPMGGMPNGQRPMGAPGQPMYGQRPAGTPGQPPMNGQVPPPPKPRKIKKSASPKKKLAVIIVAAVLVIFAGVGAACRLLPGTMGGILPRTTNFMMKYFSSSERYLKYITTETGDKGSVGKLLADATGSLKNVNGVSGGIEGSIKLTAGEGLKEIIADEAGAMASPYIDWIDSIALNYDANVTEDAAGYKIGMNVNDTDILSIDAVMDTKKGEIYASIPELNSQAIKVSLGDSYNSEEAQQVLANIQELVAVIPEEAVVEKLVNRYIECVVENLGDVEKDSDKISAGDITQKCTVISAKVDEADALNIAEAILKEAKSDSDIKNIITDFCNAGMIEADAEEVYSSFVSGIDSMLGQLEQQEASSDGESVTVNFWINSKGETVGFGVEANGAEMKFQSVEKGKKYGVILSVGSGMQAVKFEGGGKISGSKKSGSFDISVMGADVVNIKTENIDTEKLENGEFEGKITIAPSEQIGSLLSMAGASDMEDMLKGAKIELIGKTNTFELAVYTNEALFASLAVSATQKQSSDVSVDIPSNYVDVDDSGASDTWAAGINLSVLTDKLKQAGAPDSMINAMEMSMQEAQPQPTLPTDMQLPTDIQLPTEAIVPGQITLPDVEIEVPEFY